MTEETHQKYEGYEMYLKTVQGTAIKALSEALKEVLFETNIHFDSEGLKIMNMDPTQVAIVMLKLNAAEFEEFYCPKPLVIGVSMTALHKLLKTIGNNDTVALYVSKDNTDNLGIHIQNKKKRIDNHIDFNLMTVDFLEVELPEEDPDVTITMPCGEFQKYCRELANVANDVKIGVSNDGIFSMNVEGNWAKQQLDIAESDDSNITIELADKEFSPDMGTFSLKFLNLFCKSSTIGNTIQLYVGNDYPIFIVYRVASLGTCTYCLFPKVSEISLEED